MKITDRMIYEVFRRSVDKHILSERVSDVVYNFTSVRNAYRIAMNDAYFMQSSVSGNNVDNYGNRYFYMSTTRNKNTSMSYASHYADRKSGVRFEIDGDKLNNNFKGMAVDYYQESGKQMYYNNEIPFKEKQKHQDFETEDRVLSNKAVLKRFSRFLRRVDIFTIDGDEIETIANIKALWGNLVHIYDNLKDFNNQTSNEIEINTENLTEVPNEDNEREQSDDIINTLANFFLLANYSNSKNKNATLISMTKSYGLSQYLNNDFVECWRKSRSSGFPSIVKRLDTYMDFLSGMPSEDGQKALQMISNYMKRNGYKDIRQMAVSEFEKSKREDS